MNFDPNKLFYWMLQILQPRWKAKQKTVFCNEGGSRSSKSYDTFHLVVWICDQLRNSDKKLRIYFIRRTLKSCRDLTYADFKECLQIIGIYNINNVYAENIAPIYTLFGHKIQFIGLDKNIEAKASDICFYNEALEIDDYLIADGWFMRCERLVIFDWNPKRTKHWLFEWEGRKNVFWSRTTFRNNKHCPPHFIEEAMSWQPTPENIKNKTANPFKWSVYAQGRRTAPEGQVYETITWISELPVSDYYFYGLDFGYTSDPTALAKICIKDNNLYAQKLLYQPTENSNLLADLLTEIGITSNDIIIADSADLGGTTKAGFVNDLNMLGFKVIKCKKPRIVERINKVKNFNIHLVDDKDVRTEIEGYVYMTVEGHQTSIPIDDCNHFLDALGYGVWSLAEMFKNL